VNGSDELDRLEPKKSEYEYELEEEYDFRTTSEITRAPPNAERPTPNVERFLFDSCRTLSYIQ
jgi:hypothetical protein